VGQAVLNYNVGYQEGFVIPKFGESFTSIQKKSLSNRDYYRERQRRQRKSKAVKGDDSLYKAGAF